MSAKRDEGPSNLRSLETRINNLAQKMSRLHRHRRGDRRPQPEGVPDEYVMRPSDIRLAYKGRHWLTVRFELGHNEIGSSERPEYRITARRSHPWAPSVVAYPRCDTIYVETADGLDVTDNINDAINWANHFIARATR